MCELPSILKKKILQTTPKIKNHLHESGQVKFTHSGDSFCKYLYLIPYN